MNSVFRFLILTSLIISMICYDSNFSNKDNEDKEFEIDLTKPLLSRKEYFGLFQQFMKEYEISYPSMKTLLNKFETFRGNLQLSDNQYNQFSDLSSTEFSKTYLNLKFSSRDQLESMCSKLVINQDEAPESLDWRDHNVVTPVKNQSQCGSCWSFSTVANIESLYAIKSKTLEVFSEQQIIDCDTEDHGCGGGWQEKAYDYLTKNQGLETENSYPYTHKVGKCVYDSSKALVKINGCSYVSVSEDDIMKAIAHNGPVAAALNATMLQYYFGGIFKVKKPFTCDPRTLNHAVLIVGYGETKSGKKYWIVKNSWGKGWGEKGYFRIIRGEGHCGINNHILTGNLS